MNPGSGSLEHHGDPAGFDNAAHMANLGEQAQNQTEYDPRQSTEMLIVESEHIFERATEICEAVADADVIAVEDVSPESAARSAQIDAQRTRYMSSDCSPAERARLQQEILAEDEFVFAIIQPFANTNKEFRTLDLGGPDDHEAEARVLEAESRAGDEFAQAMATDAAPLVREKMMAYFELGAQLDPAREAIDVQQLTNISKTLKPMPDRRRKIAAVIGLGHWRVHDALAADGYPTQRITVTDRTHLEDGQDFEFSYAEQIGEMLREPGAEVSLELQNRALLEQLLDSYTIADTRSYRSRWYTEGEGDAAFALVKTMSDKQVQEVLDRLDVIKASDEPQKVSAMRATLRAQLPDD